MANNNSESNEIETLKELINEKLRRVDEEKAIAHAGLITEIKRIEDKLTTRLDSMDKATELLNDNFTRVPTDTDKQIKQLEMLMDEKFNGVDIKFESVAQQFRERDVRVEQSAQQTKVAVDAALQAAKEASGESNKAFTLSINKSEAATTKQIDQLNAGFQTAISGISGQISDVKDRVARIENLAVGRNEAETTQRNNTTSTQGSLGLWITVAVAATGFVTFALTHFK